MRFGSKQYRAMYFHLAVCALLPLSYTAHAQTPLPPSVGSNQLERQLETPPEPQSKAGPTFSGSAPKVDVPEGAEDLFFVLREIQLKGAEHLPDPSVLAPYQAQYGTQVSLARMYELAAAIAQSYHEAGYGFVSVTLPSQEIDDGVVTIQVIEGYISNIQLNGIPHSYLLQEAKLRLLKMRPLDTRELEKILLLLDNLPGLVVRATLEPETRPAHPGGLRLELNAAKKALSGNVAVNNHGTRYTGPWQMTSRVARHGLFTEADSISIRGLTSIPTDEAQYISLEYEVPITLQSSFILSGSHSQSEPGYDLAPQEIESEANSFSFNLKHDFLRSRKENFSMTASLDIENVDTDILGTSLYRDRIRALRLNGTYDTYDRWQAINLLGITLSQGIDALGASKTGSPDLSRAQGRSDFTKVEFNALRLQPLGNQFSFYTLVNGQYSSMPLLASEQFGFGGPVIGRAYDVSELIGDQGLAAAFELRYSGLPSLYNTTYQPFIFYEIGKVWNHSLDQEDASASDAGFGVRMQAPYDLNLNLSIAWPLTHEPSTPQSSHAYDPRIHFSLGYQF